MSNRRQGPVIGGGSYWGRIQTIEPVAPGIVFVSTPSHGGIWLAPELLAELPEQFRETGYSPGPWFEEDCDWCIPFMYFADRIRQAGELRNLEASMAAAEKTAAAFHQAFAAFMEQRRIDAEAAATL